MADVQHACIHAAIRCKAHLSNLKQPFVIMFFEDDKHVARYIDFDDELPTPILLDPHHPRNESQANMLRNFPNDIHVTWNGWRFNEPKATEFVSVIACVLRPKPQYFLFVFHRDDLALQQQYHASVWNPVMDLVDGVPDRRTFCSCAATVLLIGIIVLLVLAASYA